MMPLLKSALRAAAILTVITTLIVGPVLSTKSAHAQFTTFEVNPAIVTGVLATAANQTIQSTIMQALNGLAWTVAKTAVQSITRSTVNWINSGFQGSPAFVSDLSENLQYLGDAVAENFLNNLDAEVQRQTGFNITSPFQDQINQKLREEYYRTTGSWGLNYTLNNYSTDPKAFIQEGKFQNGGFNAWFAASQNPANNPFGAYTLASNQLWTQVDKAAQQRKAELDWGKGFLPWRGDCAASTGNAMKDSLSLSKSEKCLFNSVRTPGSVIESQLENQLGSGVRQLELADSINEIVGALVGQLVNQVLGDGGLLGASQPSSGGGQSYIDQATNGSDYTQLNSSLADGVLVQLASDRSNVTLYQQHWQTIRDAAVEAQKTCSLSQVSDAIARADAALVKASTALIAIAAQETQIKAAVASTAADKATRIATAVASYQSYLSSSSIPTNAEYAEASAESYDNGTDTEASGDTSLYSEMVSLQRSCTDRNST